MPGVIDIRASEISELRRSLRKSKKRLADINAAARDNDAILGALHKVALLLVARKRGWQTDAEKTLARALPGVSRCRIVAAVEMSAPQKQKAARLQKSGGANLPDDAFAVAGLPSAYTLPIKKGRALCGLLILYARKKDAFAAEGDSDFVLRLAELLAEAMSAGDSKSAR